MNSDDVIVVTVTFPDETAADRVAEQLVKDGLAACVQVYPCRSTYKWDGQVECACEWTCVIKTTMGRYEALEAAVLKVHSYDTPEIIATPVVKGFGGYLEWVRQEPG